MSKYLQQLRQAATAFGRAIFASTGFDSGGGSTTGHAGAASGRRLSAWQEVDTALSALMAYEGDALRRRCRGLVRKNHWARCAQDSYTANAVGTGIKPQSLHPDPALRALIHSEWNRWTDQADADGMTDYYGLQSLVVREMFEAGEVLVRLRARRPQDGFRIPLQLQILEAEHLPFTFSGPNGANVIRAGIEFTPWGKRVAYHLYPEHPGLGGMALGSAVNMPTRTPAYDAAGAPMVIHNFVPLRAGQYRGTPWLAPVMVTLYELDQFVDAVLVRQRVANGFVGWMRKLSGDAVGLSPLGESATGPDGSSKSGTAFAEIQPGTIYDLAAEDTLEFNSPPGPGAEFSAYLKTMLHAFAAGIGSTYEQVTGDLEGTSYASGRSGLLEFRRRCEQFQHQILAFQFCTPIWNRWVNDAILAGILPSPRNPKERDDLLAVRWRPPRWAWVDPLKDVLAAKESVRCLFSSRSGVIQELGDDPEEIDAEIAADAARADSLGIVSDADPRQTAATGAAQAVQKADEQQQDQQMPPPKQAPKEPIR